MTQLGSVPHCIPALCCPLSHSHFSLPLPSGLLLSGCEYWCRLCGHDGKCQLKKKKEKRKNWGAHVWWWLEPSLSAELTVCTALKRFSRRLQSNVQPEEQRLQSDRNWITSPSDVVTNSNLEPHVWSIKGSTLWRSFHGLNYRKRKRQKKF